MTPQPRTPWQLEAERQRAEAALPPSGDLIDREKLRAALDEHIYLTDEALPDGLYRGFDYDLDAILRALSGEPQP